MDRQSVADIPSVPFHRLFGVVMACAMISALAAGCILGSSRGATEIDAVVPSPHQTLGCQNEGIDGPPGRSCAFIVRGTQGQVAKDVAASLRGRGYSISCTSSRPGLGGVEVVGYKNGMRVTADVIPDGVAVIVNGDAIFYPPGTPTNGQTIAIPRNSVGLSIDASEYTATLSRGATCDSLGT
jgi:hypothetical protein